MAATAKKSKPKTPKTAAPLFGERGLEDTLTKDMEDYLIGLTITRSTRICIIDAGPMLGQAFPELKNPNRLALWWYDNKFRKELEKRS